MAGRGKRRKHSSKASEPASRQKPKAQQQSERQLVAMQAEFRGPLPPPDMLQRYEQVHPGTAERVLQQFERETQHRHAIEQKIVDAQLEAQRAEIPAFRLGQVFAFIIAVVGLVSAAYCVSRAPSAGHAWAGAGIAGISLATLAGVFIYGRKSKPAAEEPEERQQEN
jgi:uncharacterized membrane protein